MLRSQLEFRFGKAVPGQALRLQNVVAASLREAPRVPQGRGYSGRDVDGEDGTRSPQRVGKTGAASPPELASSRRDGTIHLRGRDHALESQARELLRRFGFNERVRVEWNPRLKTCAGRADYRQKLISLNPRLREVAAISIQTHFNCADVTIRESRIVKESRVSTVMSETERTLRHELAHFLAQFRAGRRRILPHGIEWREACRDLGIADEARCHNLPFASKAYPPRFIYHCPNCREEFPRVRRVRRAVACLACCRKHNRAISMRAFD